MKFSHVALSLLALTLAGPVQAAPPSYTLTKAVALGTPDRWDYVVFNAGTGRVYVAHGDRVTVVDARSGAIVGEVSDIAGGTHGTAISLATGQGFTDDGKNGQVVAFDLKTLKVTHQITADMDADAIVFDKATGHVFVIEGDPGAITVVDPATDAAIANIKVGEKLEYGTPDDKGMIYVAGEANSDLVKIDTRTNRVVAHFPTPDCVSPHGVAIDKVGRRLFMGCTNSVMMVIDADTGRVVAKLPIGKGSDAVAFDPSRRRAFSSNGADGTITVYQQTSPDAYTALAPITTQISGRTMSVDPVSGRLFVAAADTDPSTTPGGRPKVRAGTLKLLLLDPVS
ncbi:MAG: YncE family protein [Novosphingobium sp.]|nr:YncE family protein [Novosphingobium sp.]